VLLSTSAKAKTRAKKEAEKRDKSAGTEPSASASGRATQNHLLRRMGILCRYFSNVMVAFAVPAIMS